MRAICIISSVLLGLALVCCNKQDSEDLKPYKVSNEGIGMMKFDIDNYHYSIDTPSFAWASITEDPKYAWACSLTNTDTLAIIGVVKVINNPTLEKMFDNPITGVFDILFNPEKKLFINCTRVAFIVPKDKLEIQKETSFDADNVFFVYATEEDDYTFATVSKASINVSYYDGTIVSGTFHIEGSAQNNDGSKRDFETGRSAFDVTVFDHCLKRDEFPPSTSNDSIWAYYH